MLVGHLSIFFAEMPIQIVCPFFHWATCLFSLHLVNFFYIYILDSLLLPVCDLQIFANIFSQPLSCLFTLLLVSFEVQKLLILLKCHLSVFVWNLCCVCVCFDACAFGIVSMKSLPNLRLLRFMLVFSSKSFIVLTFKFSSRIYLELIFVYGVR